MVFSRGFPVELAGELIAVVLGRVLKRLGAGGENGNKTGLDICLRDSIKGSWIEDALCSFYPIRLEERMGREGNIVRIHTWVRGLWNAGQKASNVVFVWGLREITLELLRRERSHQAAGYELILPLTLIGKKEEQLVFLDGAAQRPAVLVALEIRACLLLQIAEKIICVVVRVAVEFKSAAVQAIGPGLGDDRYDASTVASILGAKVAGEHFEFLDGVRIRVVNNSVVQQIVVGATVEQEGIGIIAPPRRR